MPVNGRGDARCTDAEPVGEFGDVSVVGADHGGAERSGAPPTAAGREPADHLAVDALVGRHGRRGIRVARVR